MAQDGSGRRLLGPFEADLKRARTQGDMENTAASGDAKRPRFAADSAARCAPHAPQHDGEMMTAANSPMADFDGGDGSRGDFEGQGPMDAPGPHSPPPDGTGDVHIHIPGLIRISASGDADIRLQVTRPSECALSPPQSGDDRDHAADWEDDSEELSSVAQGGMEPHDNFDADDDAGGGVGEDRGACWHARSPSHSPSSPLHDHAPGVPQSDDEDTHSTAIGMQDDPGADFHEEPDPRFDRGGQADDWPSEGEGPGEWESDGDW